LLNGDLVLVRVVAALRDEEDLALEALARRLVVLDDLGDLLQLVAEAGGREDGVDQRFGAGERRADVDRLLGRAARAG
jgi:hypothetical protein